MEISAWGPESRDSIASSAGVRTRDQASACPGWTGVTRAVATARPGSCNAIHEVDDDFMNDLPGKRRLRPRLPTERDGAAPDMHALRTPLTVAILRVQVLRRHLLRGDGLPSLESELDQIEITLAELSVAIDRFARNG